MNLIAFSFLAWRLGVVVCATEVAVVAQQSHVALLAPIRAPTVPDQPIFLALRASKTFERHERLDLIFLIMKKFNTNIYIVLFCA